MLFAFASITILLAVGNACPFASKLNEGEPNPHANNLRRRLSSTSTTQRTQSTFIPAEYATGLGSIGDATAIRNTLMTPDNFSSIFNYDNYKGGLVGDIGKLAKSLKKDLCYWSFQSLPAPVDYQPDAIYPFKISISDAESLVALGNLAVQRWVTQIANRNPNVIFGGVAAGRIVRQAWCTFANYYGVLNDTTTLSACGKIGIANQEIVWPIASVIVKVANATGGSPANSVNIFKAWRTSQAGHVPNMEFAYGTGWGAGGEMVAKVFPCDLVPLEFNYQRRGVPKGPNYFDLLSTTQKSKTLLDVGVKYWNSLCNVWKNTKYSPQGGNCKK